MFQKKGTTVQTKSIIKCGWNPFPMYDLTGFYIFVSDGQVAEPTHGHFYLIQVANQTGDTSLIPCLIPDTQYLIPDT